MYTLGYEIGSHCIRVALVNCDTHQVLDTVRYPSTDMEVIAKQFGWAEQHPEIWWQHVISATRKILAQNAMNPADIRAIGITYQMHGLVLVDKDQEVIRPAIIWSDSRSVEVGKQLYRDLGESYCLEHLLNSPGNFTAAKLRWVMLHEPFLFERVHKFMLPGDYIALRLTGEINTTIPGLSEGIFWNFRNKRVDNRLLKYLQLDPALFPDPVTTFGEQGVVCKSAADAIGLQPGTPVTYRVGDQPNHAFSLNVLHPGEMAATCDSSGVVYGVVDHLTYDHQSRVNTFAHVNYEQNRDRLGVLLCINGAGAQFHWLDQQINRPGRSFDDLEKLASSIPIGSNKLCIIPFGNGTERILRNRNVESHILHLDFNQHSQAHLIRASIEGVAFSFVYGIDIFREMKVPYTTLKVSNSDMFRSEVFTQTISTLLDIPIEVNEVNDAAGAALAAGYGAGHFGSLEETLGPPKTSHWVEPSGEVSAYQESYQRWAQAMKDLLNDRKESTPKSSRNLRKQLQEQSRINTRLAAENMIQKDLLQDLQTQLTQFQKSGATESKILEWIKSIDSHLGEGGWQDFSRQFDLLNDEFIQTLMQKYPNLSNPELKLAAYLKMKLRTKEIADLLNISVRGVETRRYRLRKKLQLQKDQSLQAFFSSLN